MCPVAYGSVWCNDCLHHRDPRSVLGPVVVGVKIPGLQSRPSVATRLLVAPTNGILHRLTAGNPRTAETLSSMSHMPADITPSQTPRATPARVSIPRQLGGFALRITRGFLRNGGLVLSGALAYNALLSVPPLLLLATSLFAGLVDRAHFVQVVTRELHQILPASKARPLIDAVLELLEVPYSGGLVGFVTLLFFSTLGFRTLEHALDVVFAHRRALHHPRPLWLSIVISLCYVFAIGLVSLLQTLAMVSLPALPRAIQGISSWASWFGVLGVLGMTLVLISIYEVMPLGRGNLRAVCIGALFSTLLWRAVQSAMVFYFENVSAVSLIYGSMAAVIVVLFSFELAAIIVLLGAQVVAEIEQSWKADRRWYECATTTDAKDSQAPEHVPPSIQP
jgi:membrane protein